MTDQQPAPAETNPQPSAVADELAAFAAQVNSKLRPVVVDGFTKKTFVRMLTVQQRSEMEEALAKITPDMKRLDADKAAFRAALVKFTAVDDAGNLLFASQSIAQIRDWPSSVVEPFVNESLTLNHFGADAAEDLKKT